MLTPLHDARPNDREDRPSGDLLYHQSEKNSRLILLMILGSFSVYSSSLASGGCFSIPMETFYLSICEQYDAYYRITEARDRYYRWCSCVVVTTKSDCRTTDSKKKETLQLPSEDLVRETTMYHRIPTIQDWPLPAEALCTIFQTIIAVIK